MKAPVAPGPKRGAPRPRKPTIMPSYAIKTGRTFTVVTVHSNQCSVRLRDGSGALFVNGTGKHSIQAAARDGAGESFKTLHEAIDSREDVIRARDLDC
jgi:hypothetical protein